MFAAVETKLFLKVGPHKRLLASTLRKKFSTEMSLRTLSLSLYAFWNQDGISSVYVVDEDATAGHPKHSTLHRQCSDRHSYMGGRSTNPETVVSEDMRSGLENQASKMRDQDDLHRFPWSSTARR